MKKYILFGVTLIVVVSAFFVIFKRSFADSGIKAKIEKPYIVLTNDSRKSGSFFPDSHFFTFKFNGNLYGILPGVQSFLVSDPMAAKISTKQLFKLSYLKGQAGKFDAKGVWLDSVFVRGADILGFYHGENGLNLVGNKNLAGIGVATATDPKGAWKMTHERLVGGGYKDHSADPVVITKGDYLYMFYNDRTTADNDTRRTIVARAPVSSANDASAWKKYYCDAEVCDFSSPANSTKATALSEFFGNPFVVYNSYLNKYLLVSSSSMKVNPKQDRKSTLRILYSDDLINWKNLFEKDPELPTPGEGVSMIYPSFISLEGSSDVIGKEFWMYYIYQKNSMNSLLRMKITLEGVLTN